MIVPQECVRFIRWQRTKFTTDKFPDDEEVARLYVLDCQADFASIEAHLPKKVESIIDIGCGVGGVTTLIARRFPNASLFLLDGDGEETEVDASGCVRGKGGWNPDGLKPFNSRAATELFLAANGVTVAGWYDCGTKQRLAADLIVSIASCGYHYPLAAYDFHGFSIMDVRNAELPKIGHPCTSLVTRPKYRRLAWTRA